MPGPHHTSSHRFHPDEILWPGENHTIGDQQDRKSTRLNSSHTVISYAVFCLKKKTDAHGFRRHRDFRWRLPDHRSMRRVTSHPYDQLIRVLSLVKLHYTDICPTQASHHLVIL